MSAPPDEGTPASQKQILRAQSSCALAVLTQPSHQLREHVDRVQLEEASAVAMSAAASLVGCRHRQGFLDVVVDTGGVGGGSRHIEFGGAAGTVLS